VKTPLIALIGRPNTGKSTLLNTIVGNKVSIVDDEAGVTRDRVYADTTWNGRLLSVIDTGGLDFDENSNIYSAHIKEQVEIAIDIADCVVFVTDGMTGMTAGDQDIAKLLRRAKKPVIVAVNKIDNKTLHANNFHEFYSLGFQDTIPVSCTQKSGLGDLLDTVMQKLKLESITEEPSETETPTRIAIIGKPNAGKSSIVNKLLGEKRVMVSEHAGTTRDSIDTPFRANGKNYILTDTAGIRRKRSIETETIEHYSVVRALAAIRNSDVCVLVVDAEEMLTEQDVRLAGYIDEMGKPSVICINKWDLIEKDTHTINTFTRNLDRDLAFMPYFKSVFTSALTGQRIGEIMKAVEFVIERSQTRITTGTLNTLIGEFVATTPPPFVSGKRAKFMYSTQVSISPPTFALFVNERDIVPSTYLRYLENCLRKSVDLTGTPIRLLLRNRNKKEEKK
jgi:GTP-binding protein